MKRISLVCSILVFLFLGGNAVSQEALKPVLRQPSQVEFLIPNEQRDHKYAKFLAASVKISSGGASGSGTICNYDRDSQYAYVISCGHLWDGDKPYGRKTANKARITVWYHNDFKLPEPKNYDAEILFWSNQRGYDVSLIRFKPDWVPNYFPIARRYEATSGTILNSLGCDGGKEVARYEVRVKEFRNPDLITFLNSPRPGRSGGGLLTDQGELVGVCWGTSDTESGEGIGFFTPVPSVKETFNKNDHGWLLDLRLGNKLIPIVDWDNPSKIYGSDFIPDPSF